MPVTADDYSGTQIRLERLRQRWTPGQLGTFLGEAQAFQAPPILREPLDAQQVPEPLLFKEPRVRDVRSGDPGFHVDFAGDLDAGQDFWDTLLASASWVIEIEARVRTRSVRYAIVPTKRTRDELGDVGQSFEIAHPQPQSKLSFDARILIREGLRDTQIFRSWARRAAGIRVYMEGFRVLPYGEPGNDWLKLDEASAARRRRELADRLDPKVFGPEFKDEGLVMLGNDSYFGAIFLTEQRAPTLEMLVNREGFIPNASFDVLTNIVRTGVDVSTRVRAAATVGRRRTRSDARSKRIPFESAVAEPMREQLAASVERARSLVGELRTDLASGHTSEINAKSRRLEAELDGIEKSSLGVVSEQAMLRVLASVGLQMARFVHEIRALVLTAHSVDQVLQRLRKDPSLDREARRRLRVATDTLTDMRRRLERQASYLVDIVTPDARRRRTRQRLAERFDTASRLLETPRDARGLQIENAIPSDLRSPPMFPAELTAIFSNLLTNAVKATEDGGRIRATGGQRDGRTVVRIENTGTAVDPESGERWFRPFESSTTEIDPLLGQGMGLGLPITRALLDDYNAEIRFTRPRRGFATSVEIAFQ